MKNLFLIGLIAFCSQLAAIEFAPIGAEWYYNLPDYMSLNGNDFEYVKITSVKDTIIDTKHCRKLELINSYDNKISAEYIYQTGDSIYYYNYYSQTFHLLYCFSAKINDTINVHINKFKATDGFFSYSDSINNFQYKIVSIDTVTIDGKEYKRQKVKSLSAYSWFFYNNLIGESYIIEGIGSVEYFFGVSSDITPETVAEMLRCYTDNDIKFKNEEWNIDCDYTTGLNENIQDFSIKVYPNPVTDIINIESEEIINNLVVCDNYGKAIIELSANCKNIVLNMSDWIDGIYYLQIRTDKSELIKTVLKYEN